MILCHLPRKFSRSVLVLPFFDTYTVVLLNGKELGSHIVNTECLDSRLAAGGIERVHGSSEDKLEDRLSVSCSLVLWCTYTYTFFVLSHVAWPKPMVVICSYLKWEMFFPVVWAWKEFVGVVMETAIYFRASALQWRELASKSTECNDLLHKLGIHIHEGAHHDQVHQDLHKNCRFRMDGKFTKRPTLF